MNRSDHSMLFVLFVLLLSACAAPLSPPTSIPATAIPPPPVPTNPPPTLAPTVMPTLRPTLALPTREPFRLFQTAGIDVGGDPENAGTFRTPAGFTIPFRFETNDTFRGGYEGLSGAQLFALQQGRAASGAASHWIMFATVSNKFSPTQAITELVSDPVLTAGEMISTTVGGVSAVQFDAQGKREGTLGIRAIGTLVGVGQNWDTESIDSRLRFYVLEVDGRTLMIYVEAPQADFETFSATAEKILTTVEFTKK